MRTEVVPGIAATARRWLHVTMLAVSWCLIPTPASASAPAVCPLLDARPADPAAPTVVTVAVHPDCPPPGEVQVRVSRATGESVGSTTVNADNRGLLTLDLARWLPAGRRSGVYRLLWQPIGAPQQTHLEQLHTISCAGPPVPVTAFGAADSRLAVELPPGDACQGDTVVELRFVDDLGRPVRQPLTHRVPSATGGRLQFDLRQVDPQLRRQAALVLSNATGEQRTVSLQLGEVCPGDIRATGEVQGQRLQGKLSGDACHFPVIAHVSVTTESGATLPVGQTVLRGASFYIDLPRTTRTNEPFRVTARFEAASTAQTTLTVIGNAGCPPPKILDPVLERGEGQEAVLTASYSTLEACHGSSKLTLQLRDPQNNVVFNRSLEATPSPSPIPLRWPLTIKPGLQYDLQATILYGADRAQTTSGRLKLNAECTAPQIADLGFTDADAQVVGAHLRFSACNVPLTAKLMVRDAGGRPVAAYERVIRVHKEAVVYPLVLGTVANLDSGRYAATLTLTDPRGRTQTQKLDITRDPQPPQVRFVTDGQSADPQTTPTVAALSDVQVEITDPSGLLSAVEPLAEEPPPAGQSVRRTVIRQATAGTGAEIRIRAEYEIDADAEPALPVGVLLRAGDRLWTVPAIRRYIVFDEEFLSRADSGTELAGILAISDTASLSAGDYRVAGVILERRGQEILLPVEHQISVSPVAHRRALASLRHGVEQIPVQVSKPQSGRASLSTERAVPPGRYSLQVEAYDRFGNSSGPVVQQIVIGTPDGPQTQAPTLAETRPDDTLQDGNLPTPESVSATDADRRLELARLGGQLVLPDPLTLELRVEPGDGASLPGWFGDARVASVRVQPRAPLVGRSVPATATLSPDGLIQVALPALRPGDYDLRLDMAGGDASAPQALSLSTNFSVLDGRPIRATVFSLRTRGRAPLTGHLSISFPDPASRMEVASVGWERSADGVHFEPLPGEEDGIDFAIDQPGVAYYRARIVNRHTQVASHTDPIRLTALPEERLTVDGPDRTFRGYPIELKASGVPADRVLWRVIVPGGDTFEEHKGDTLTIDAQNTGTFFVETVALDAAGDAAAPTSPRVYRSIEVLWPRVPPSVIAGPTHLEPGRSAIYTVSHPPLFQGRGNPDVVRKGEWELPDGRRIPDQEFAEVTLVPDADPHDGALVQYHSWLDGSRDETLTTAVMRVTPDAYVWPRWTLDAQTVSASVPSIYRLVVRPATWEGWLGMSDATLRTDWQLPPDLRVLRRNDRELIVQVSREQPFDVSAKVIDDRGNAAQVSATDVSPYRRTLLEIETLITPERPLHTAPLKVKVSAKPLVVPPGRKIERVAVYLNGQPMGATPGPPLALDLSAPGRYHIRTIASIGTDIVAENSTLFEVLDNAPAVCEIEFLGEFAINGVAKANCTDPDGHIVDYRWYRNGELFDTAGPRVRLNPSQLQGLKELSLVVTDNAGKEATARIEPPAPAAES